MRGVGPSWNVEFMDYFHNAQYFIEGRGPSKDNARCGAERLSPVAVDPAAGVPSQHRNALLPLPDRLHSGPATQCTLLGVFFCVEMGPSSRVEPKVTPLSQMGGYSNKDRFFFAFEEFPRINVADKTCPTTPCIVSVGGGWGGVMGFLLHRMGRCPVPLTSSPTSRPPPTPPTASSNSMPKSLGRIFSHQIFSRCQIPAIQTSFFIRSSQESKYMQPKILVTLANEHLFFCSGGAGEAFRSLPLTKLFFF